MRVGGKKIYLPNFTVALIRTPHLPPNFAQFEVPLNLNKLDLRDYLRHAYGVEVHAIRSFVKQMPIERSHPSNPRRIQYWRPQSIKRMTVELVKPFVYPEEPTDLTPWDNELYTALEMEREQEQRVRRPDAFKLPPVKDRRVIQALAEEKLAARRRALVEDEAGMVEVEKELTL